MTRKGQRVWKTTITPLNRTVVTKIRLRLTKSRKIPVLVRNVCEKNRTTKVQPFLASPTDTVRYSFQIILISPAQWQV